MKRIIFIILSILLFTSCSMEKVKEDKNFKNIRSAMTAGQFYPADEAGLKFKIEKYLEAANYTSPRPSPSQGEGVNNEVKAIMVPHAGLDYSGGVAAYGYNLLKEKEINTVVIICNSHSTYFSGIAIDKHDAWETPLGTVAVNTELANKLVNSNEKIKFNEEPFNTPDQTLEIQVPFLQVIIENFFKIVPVFFGNKDSATEEASYKALAKALAENLGENDIIIISTDMSHYPAYEDANTIDQETLDIIKTAKVSELEKYVVEVMNKGVANEQTLLCGIDGVKTVMELYNLKGWDKIEILKYANSGDVLIGDKSSVVGYGTVAFFKNQNAKINPPAGGQNDNVKTKNDNVLNDEQKKELLRIAKVTVENFVREGKEPEFEISDERLNRKEGAFVTLHKNGELRGCIGQIIPTDKPLWQVVRDQAVSACSEDHRFQPVSVNELDNIDYEISVLSVPELIDDWQKIELGKHGVIVQKGAQGGVFLPQVATETGWSLEEFLSELCWQKARLAPDCYKNDPEVKLLVFTAQVFH